MGFIDVSELLTDVDFTDAVTRIRRSSSVTSDGLNSVTETSETITVVIYTLGKNQLQLVPEGVRVTDAIAVYHQGQIQNEGPGEYADMIVWGGQRYKATAVLEDWMHMGAGFTVTLCVRETVYAE